MLNKFKFTLVLMICIILKINFCFATDNVSFKLSNTDWSNKSIGIKFENIPANNQSIKYTMPNSKTFVNYIGEFFVLNNGIGKIKLMNKNGQETIYNYEVSNIDAQKPKDVDIVVDGIAGKVFVTARDNEATTTSGVSGIDKIKYQWSDKLNMLDEDDNSWNYAKEIYNKSWIDISKNKNHNYLQLLVIDRAGNKLVEVKSINRGYLYENANSVELKFSREDYFNDCIEAVITGITDEVKSIEYTLPGNINWLEYQNFIMINNNGTGYIKVLYKNGDEKVISYEITKFDNKIPQKVEISPNGVMGLKEKINVRILAEDNEGGSGIEKLKYQWTSYKEAINENDTSWNNADSTPNNNNLLVGGKSTPRYLQILACDRAGNKCVVVSNPYSKEVANINE